MKDENVSSVVIHCRVLLTSKTFKTFGRKLLVVGELVNIAMAVMNNKGKYVRYSRVFVQTEMVKSGT